MAEPHIVQNGWHIHSRDGVDLGTVIESAGDTLIVRGDDGGRWSIPKEDIAEEEEGTMVAILSIDADQVVPADA